MFLPGILKPLPHGREVSSDVARWLEAPFTILSGPVGTARPERLATVIDHGGRWHDCVWLRPEPRAAPGTVTQLMAEACRYRWGDGEQANSSHAPPLPAALALAPTGAVVVLELTAPSGRAARRVVRDLQAASDGRPVRVVVLLERRKGLGLAPHRAAAPDDPGTDQWLPEPHRRRLLGLAGPRRALAHDVAEAARGDQRDAILDAIATSVRPGALLDRVAGILIADLPEGGCQALQACLATGYWHPGLVTDPMPIEALRPWVVALEQGWGWLRPMWADALRQQLAVDPVPPPSSRPEAPAVSRPEATVLVPAPRSPQSPPAGPGPAPAAVLEVRLLGEFEVRVDGLRVDRWRGQKGPAVLRFLLARPRRACARDALIEEFWPDVAPEVARNRLQVAVSGLRRSLRDLTRCEVVAFGDGEYRIHPDIRVDLDVDRFEAALRRAGIASGSGTTDHALEAYREAIEAYRGDFAADAPFETWTLVPRECHRLSYVDALDAICRLQLEAGRLDEAITTGQRMLETDPCREDAHRLLMDCYRRLGRAHQVARQYELCVRVLRARLDVEPDALTTRLYRTAVDRCTPLTSHDALGEA